MAKMSNLEDLLVDSLKDLYSAEKQILKALPRMAKKATSPDLRRSFENHIMQTEQQVARLEKIFDDKELDGSPRGKKCIGMEGLVKEGAEIMSEDAEPMVMDAGLIAAAQKVEHYEIAAYGTARTYASTLGKKKVADLLQTTLEEEAQTNEKLTSLAVGHINRQAGR